MSDLLKDCPFCGTRVELYEYEEAGMVDPYGGDSHGRFRIMTELDYEEARDEGDDGLFSVMCPNCPAMMNDEGTVDEIIEKWNRRVGNGEP